MSDDLTDSDSVNEAMLAYLAGDNDVVSAAREVWIRSGLLHATTGNRRATKRDLQIAVDSFTAAIEASGLPAEQAHHAGAALMLRLGRDWLRTEADTSASEPLNTL